MTREIERKFLLDRNPDLVDGRQAETIAQGYLAQGDAVEVRLRSRGEDRLLTVKGGTGLVRTEVSVPVTAEQFDALWPLTEGQRVVKRRWVVPADDVEYEIDVFAGDLSGLAIAEVEFASPEAGDAFSPPPWLGREVTDDERYRNAALARDGLPARP